MALDIAWQPDGLQRDGPQVRVPVDSRVRSLLIQHGSADQAVSLGQFAALITELESAGIRHEATSYSGAPHAFSVFGSDNYRADADAKSWRRFTEFLGEVTKG